MTATGAPDNGVPAAPADHLPEPHTAVATATDAIDLETRHRLRRALRILLAARRRDDGGPGHIESN